MLSRLFQSLRASAEQWLISIVYMHIYIYIERHPYHNYSWRHPCIYVFIFLLSDTTMMLCTVLARYVCGGHCSKAYLPQLRNKKNRVSKSSFSLGCPPPFYWTNRTHHQGSRIAAQVALSKKEYLWCCHENILQQRKSTTHHSVTTLRYHALRVDGKSVLLRRNLCNLVFHIIWSTQWIPNMLQGVFRI